MNAPPKYKPTPKTPQAAPPRHYPRTLGLIFAADPFDPAMVRSSVHRELTPLGVVVNTYHWIRMNPAAFGPAAAPILASCEETMKRECPDVLAELSSHVYP